MSMLYLCIVKIKRDFITFFAAPKGNKISP